MVCESSTVKASEPFSKMSQPLTDALPPLTRVKPVSEFLEMRQSETVHSDDYEAASGVSDVGIRLARA